MADIDPPPEYANVEAIRQAFGSLSSEIPRLGNQQIANQNQYVINQLGQITQQLGQITQRLDQHSERFDQVTQRLDQHSERLDQITQRLDQHAQASQRIEARLTRSENATTKIKNSQRISANPIATLLPLQNPQTGEYIQHCPEAVAEISRLSSARATRLLTQLQVPIPRSLRSKREAVQVEFL